MLTLDLSFRIRMRPVDRREREFIGLTLVYTNSDATKTNVSLKVSEEQQFVKGKEICEGAIRTSIVPTKDHLQNEKSRCFDRWHTHTGTNRASILGQISRDSHSQFVGELEKA